MTMTRLTFLIAAIALLPVGAAFAETQDRAGFLPLEAGSPSVGETDRQTPERPGLVPIALPAANLADIDTNRDGRISFAELVRHDLEKDF